MRLDNDTKIVISKENVISISVADHDKNRAAELANAYVEELLKLNPDIGRNRSWSASPVF